MRNKLFMRECFNFLVTKYPSKEEIEAFCFKNNITTKRFHQQIRDYVKIFANSVERKAYDHYLYLFHYEKIIEKIMNTPLKEDRITLLIENAELYGMMRGTYLNYHPENRLKIKQLDVEYREAIDVKNRIHRKINGLLLSTDEGQQRYIDSIEELLMKVEEKVQNDHFYIEDELREARNYISILSKEKVALRDQYNKRVTHYYNLVLKQVLKDFSENKENYSVVDYYYTTDILPMYLFKRADLLNKAIEKRAKELGNDVLRKPNPYITLKRVILERISNNNTFITTPLTITRKQASSISQYTYHGVCFDLHDLEHIYDFMIQEGLPSYENVYYGLLKECAIKGELVSRKEKKNFVKKLEKRVS